MTNIINLTPHTLNIHSPEGSVSAIEPSGSVARVGSCPGAELSLDLPVQTFAAPTWGQVEGLPAPKEDTIYIVSGMVAGRLSGRPDVFSPGTGPRDNAIRKDGRIVGVTRLIQSPQ